MTPTIKEKLAALHVGASMHKGGMGPEWDDTTRRLAEQSFVSGGLLIILIDKWGVEEGTKHFWNEMRMNSPK